MTVFASAKGLAEAGMFFEELPDIAERAAVLAINQVADRDGLAVIRRDMREQINFPKGYLERGDRLGVVRKARKGDLTAIIRGRDRATSLARFLTPGQRPDNTNGRGLRVEVKNGKVRNLKRAFMVTLKNGNIGVAVRLKPGEAMENSERAVRLADNVFLLYGPSVDQVFQGVAQDRTDDIGDMLERQFYRQIDRLTNK